LSDDVRELVARCLEGDELAMAALVERYRGDVFGLCLRMLTHREDAEDATQETFVRVLRHLARWDNQRDFRPWLLAIAGNRCRTMLAQRSQRPQPTDLVEEVPDGAPDRQVARNLIEEVELALAGLREEYRQAFLLFHEQQLSYIEIAEAMSCPVGTAKTWVHRARREMAGRLERRGVTGVANHELRRL